jgi:Glycosyltransferase family 87
LLGDRLATKRIGLPPVLMRFAWLVAAMTLLSEAYSWAMSHFFHQRPPYGGTFNWQDAGSDFMIFRERFSWFHTPHFWDSFAYPFTYPAPLGVAYWLLYKPPHPYLVYLVFSIAVLALWAWCFSARLSAYGVSHAHSLAMLLLFLAAAWPVRMLLETGNMETLVALALGAGVLATLRGRYWLGAALIGIAGSMKFYPLTLLLLLLPQRRYKEFAAGLLAAALVTLVSLVILGPSIFAAQHHINDGLIFFEHRYILFPVVNGLQFSHSLFNLVKLGIAAAARLHGERTASPDELQRAAAVYVPVVALLSVALYVVRIRHLPMLNQVIGLTVCAVLLPPYSLDYTLVQLLVPLALLCIFAVAEWRQGRQPPGLDICFACFAFIFTTGAYFQWKYRFAAQVRTLAMLVLLAAVLHYRYADAGETA